MTMKMKRQISKKKKTPSELLADLELPYSHGLMLEYKLIEKDANALTVMRVMWKVAKYPAVAKQRDKGFPIETILRVMSRRNLAALRKRVKRKQVKAA